MKTLSENGLKLIKSFEGLRLIAYDDLQPNVTLTSKSKILGTLTIGYGHTSNVSVGQTITQEQADKLFYNDLTRFVYYVNDSDYVPMIDKLNQNQFDALVSFAYNCGQANLKRLCNSSIANIALYIREYNKSKGKVLNGLVKRRQAEYDLFTKANLVPIKNFDDTVWVELTDSMRIKELEEKVKLLEDRISDIPPPKWFISEFPNISLTIEQKTGSLDFWRAIAITLRILNK